MKESGQISEAETGEQKENGETSLRESILEWIKTLVYAIVLALFIRAFFLATYVIPTGSMEPTLRGAMNYGQGDRIIAIKLIYGIRIPFTDKIILEMTEPKRGDVVVFEGKGISEYKTNKNLIKRIAGQGGERLQIVSKESYSDTKRSGIHGVKGNIHINGELVEEPASIAERMYYPAGKYGSAEVSVPDNHYFMLGDNASNSRDSRYWGFVPRKNIVGKAVAIYWPLKRMQRIR
jgi:signal peptidase I